MAVELISQIWQLFCMNHITGHPDGEEERVNFDRCEGPCSSILSC
jgi:hypothetical protein